MAFVPAPLLEAAVDSLRNKHPVAVLVIPAMVRAGVRVVATANDGLEYGSADEIRLLKDYFQVPGGPPGEPFRAIWEEKPENFWRDERYPGRSLQRMRTDLVKQGRGLFQKKERGRDLWGLRPNAGNELDQYITAGRGQVRIADLAIWYGRTQATVELSELIQWFLTTFPINQNALIGTVYSEDVPPHYVQIPFSPDPVSYAELATSVGATPPPPTPTGNARDFIVAIESCLRAKAFELQDGFVSRVIEAWLRGEIVILAGPPGTGKTKFAELLAQCLRSAIGDLQVVWVTVRPDFDEAEMIGYERLDGHAQLRPFSTLVLRSSEPLAPHLVVLEEFNLSLIENYLASILAATQDPLRRVSLPAGEQAFLPVDTFILATGNPYLDEPETRMRVSFPTKRRAAIISMPNILFQRYTRGGIGAVPELVAAMIRQESEAISDRDRAGRGAAFDSFRKQTLETVQSASDLDPETLEVLLRIVRFLLDSAEGRDYFTLGLLRDLALGVAYAGRDRESELRALGQLVADKIVHQLRGPKVRADQFRGVIAGLPNEVDISGQLDRMKAGPGDELLPLL